MQNNYKDDVLTGHSVITDTTDTPNKYCNYLHSFMEPRTQV